jgi:hypothetical protein
MAMARFATWTAAGVGLVALLLSGCPDRTQTQGLGCSEDSHCGTPVSAHRCETQTGTCYCRTNEACTPRQFCNTAGFCQDKSGCEKNADCLGADLFCDTSTGSCLSYGRCSNDLHCPLGQVCDSKRASCVEGCRTNGDCPGVSCRCGDLPCACAGGTEAERAACEVGVCDPYFCSDESYCAYGELCGVPPDAGTGRNECYSDYDPNRRPYCDNCSFGGGTNVCGTGPNYCLVDNAHPGNSFCGADCSQGQDCPRGYRCADVIVVMRQWACTRSNPACPVNTQYPCTESAQCPRGGNCVKQPGAQQTGYCAPACAVAEGNENGFCSCLVDSDCAQESCSMGECTISRRPCITEQDCRPIHCVDFNGRGGCLIGENCAPANGLTCLQVQ